eukprot:g55537.t1
MSVKRSSLSGGQISSLRQKPVKRVKSNTDLDTALGEATHLDVLSFPTSPQFSPPLKQYPLLTSSIPLSLNLPINVPLPKVSEIDLPSSSCSSSSSSSCSSSSSSSCSSSSLPLSSSDLSSPSSSSEPLILSGAKSPVYDSNGPSPLPSPPSSYLSSRTVARLTSPLLSKLNVALSFDEPSKDSSLQGSSSTSPKSLPTASQTSTSAHCSSATTSPPASPTPLISKLSPSKTASSRSTPSLCSSSPSRCSRASSTPPCSPTPSSRSSSNVSPRDSPCSTPPGPSSPILDSRSLSPEPDDPSSSSSFADPSSSSTFAAKASEWIAPYSSKLPMPPLYPSLGEQRSLAFEMQVVCSWAVLSIEEASARADLISRLEQAVKASGLFPHEGQLYVFGSFPAGLSIANSDLDLCLSIANSDLDLCIRHWDPQEADWERLTVEEVAQRQRPRLGALERSLAQLPWIAQVKSVLNTKVPLVTLTDRITGVEADLSLEGGGMQTSAFVSACVKHLPPFRSLAIVLKLILYQEDLHKPFTGGLGSFRLYVLIASYLQAQPQPFKDVGTLLVGFCDYFLNCDLSHVRASFPGLPQVDLSCHHGSIVRTKQVLQNCASILRHHQCMNALFHVIHPYMLQRAAPPFPQYSQPPYAQPPPMPVHSAPAYFPPPPYRYSMQPYGYTPPARPDFPLQNNFPDYNNMNTMMSNFHNFQQAAAPGKDMSFQQMGWGGGGSGSSNQNLNSNHNLSSFHQTSQPSALHPPHSSGHTNPSGGHGPSSHSSSHAHYRHNRHRNERHGRGAGGRRNSGFASNGPSGPAHQSSNWRERPARQDRQQVAYGAGGPLPSANNVRVGDG